MSYRDPRVTEQVLNRAHSLEGKELRCKLIEETQNSFERNEIRHRENSSELKNERGGNQSTHSGNKGSQNSEGVAFSPKLDPFFRVCLEFVYGIRDSLQLKKVGEFILISTLIKKLLFKTILINGLLIVGSAAILKLFINSSFVLSLKHSDIAQIIFSVLYHVLYLIPLYIFSFVVNTFDYMDMATEALTLEQKLFKNRGVTTPAADIVTRIYNEVINALILIFFLIQSFVISFFPYFGPIFSLVSQSFMYAFYCFTYKWGTDQVDLYRILAFFEKHFFYFAGFGFVYACITRLFPGIMGGGVYAALFPIFLLLSIKASPPKDLEINSFSQFKTHLRLMFKKKKQERPAVELDYIHTFNYQEICQEFKSKIGIFTFPLMGKKLCWFIFG